MLCEDVYSPNYLEHHGILGQKWGIRRYQNSDGSLTDDGKKRYAHDTSKVEEAQSKAKHRESKTNEKAAEYNRASMKLKIARYPFEKPIKKFNYDINKFGYDRAYNSAHRKTRKYLKKYGKKGLDVLSDKQIHKGKEFLNHIQSNQMIQATMNSRMDALRADMRNSRR